MRGGFFFGFSAAGFGFRKNIKNGRIMNMEKHPLHLKNPELQTSPEV